MTQKKRRTKGSQGNRRSHHALKPTTLNQCPKCNKAVKPHQECPFCGTYKYKEHAPATAGTNTVSADKKTTTKPKK